MPWTGDGVYVAVRPFDSAGGAAGFGDSVFAPAFFGAAVFATGFFLEGVFFVAVAPAFFFIFMGRTLQQPAGDGQGAERGAPG
jgi:hypothetical protein